MKAKVHTYHIDLRPAELILLRRALKIYSRTYQDLAVKSKPQWEKDDLQGMAKAADQLFDRLLHNIKRENS